MFITHPILVYDFGWLESTGSNDPPSDGELYTNEIKVLQSTSEVDLSDDEIGIIRILFQFFIIILLFS